MIYLNKKNLKFKKIFIALLLLVLIFGATTKTVLAQISSISPSMLYVPLIGITAVPDPLALPNGAGNVTYNYAVKNFLKEVPLTNIQVTDDKCSPVKFVEGDDNKDTKLDYSETWRYTCTTRLSQTTQSIATATGVANNITATHKAYSTVVVGSNIPPPLVSIVNITKVAYPLSLPSEGGKITYIYKVNNPGIVPLSDVTVTDDKCSVMSGKLGDTNGNNLLDINEVWIYNCSTILKQTTTNTVRVVAFANGLQALSNDTITVKVNSRIAQSVPNFPIAGTKPNVEVNPYIKTTVWAILSGILVILIILFFLTRKNKLAEEIKKLNPLERGKK